MEEKPTAAEEIQDTSEVVPEASRFTTPPRWEKLKLHKFKILGGILGVLVLTGAVFGAYKLGQKSVYPEPVERPTPTPIATLTPTPTPPLSPVETPSSIIQPTKTIKYTVVSGWTRYDNISGGYSIQYNPIEYTVVDSDLTNPTFSIIDQLNLHCVAPNCQTGIWIRIYSNYDGGSRREWLEEVRNISRTERYLEDVIVENKKALIAMDDRITEVAIPLSDRMVSIEMKGPFYSVTQKKPFNIDFVYQFLSTFRFLE